MAVETPEWVIMLYLSGDNNLSPEMVRAIDAIGALGGPPHVGVTIQFDPAAAGVPPERLLLSPGQRLKKVPVTNATGPRGEPRFIDEDSADPETLARFVEWSLTQFPDARQRMLVLSGHGSGAVGDFLTDNDAPAAPQSLTIPRLREAFDLAQYFAVNNKGISETVRYRLERNEERLFQILGMDSCLMSMAEVAFEVRSRVEFFVASEGFVPNAGWPYALMLDRLRERIARNRSGERERPRSIDPETISAAIVHDFLTFYRDYIPAGISVDMAAYDLRDGKLEAVGNAVADLVDAVGDLSEPDIQNAVILAHWRAQSFKFEQYTDLWDFCDLTRKELERHPFAKDYVRIIDACTNVQKAINLLVGRDGSDGIGAESRGESSGRQGVEGIDFQHAHGLSLYFPWSLPMRLRPRVLNDGALAVEPDAPPRFLALGPYQRLAFAAKSKWGEFLPVYLSATMRPRRGEHVPASAPVARSDGKASDSSGRKAYVATSGTASGGARFGPESGRFGPESGRFGPESGRFGPESGRFGPESGRFGDLAKFIGSMIGGPISGSTKNPPQQAGVD